MNNDGERKDKSAPNDWCVAITVGSIFKWAVGGHSEAARGAGPLGFALIRIMQTEGREKRTTDKVNYGPTNDKNTNL